MSRPQANTLRKKRYGPEIRIAADTVPSPFLRKGVQTIKNTNKKKDFIWK